MLFLCKINEPKIWNKIEFVLNAYYIIIVISYDQLATFNWYDGLNAQRENIFTYSKCLFLCYYISHKLVNYKLSNDK